MQRGWTVTKQRISISLSCRNGWCLALMSYNIASPASSECIYGSRGACRQASYLQRVGCMQIMENGQVHGLAQDVTELIGHVTPLASSQQG